MRLLKCPTSALRSMEFFLRFRRCVAFGGKLDCVEATRVVRCAQMCAACRPQPLDKEAEKVFCSFCAFYVHEGCSKIASKKLASTRSDLLICTSCATASRESEGAGCLADGGSGCPTVHPRRLQAARSRHSYCTVSTRCFLVSRTSEFPGS